MLSGHLSDEIRINPKYTHLYKAEYDKSLKGDSTPIIHKNTLLTNDYLRRITIGMGSKAPSVLPPNCRYIEKLRQGHIVVIEEPPAFRTVRINMGWSTEFEKLKAAGKLEEYGYEDDYANCGAAGVRSFNLAFPFVIFIFYLSNYHEISAGQAYLRVARLSGLSDYLMKIPLTNISDGQYICFGSKVGGAAETLNAGVEKGINVFWGAEFNTDYTYNYAAYKHVAGINSYMEWQGLSQSNPMFIYNVDWVKLAMNVGQAVDEIKRHYKLTNPNDVEYKTLSQMFKSPLDSGIDERPSKRSRKKYRLFYDVAEGVYLDDHYYVHVGDPFHIKNGKNVCYINSFISFNDSGTIKYVRVERDDGRLIRFKYTKAVINYLKEHTKALRYEQEGILKNGVVVKEGDILHMKNAIGNDIYKKVAFIRKSTEGHSEGRFGDGFYILENTEGEVYDVSTPSYGDVKLKKKTKYLYMHTRNDMPFVQSNVVNFDGVDTGRSGRLNLSFHNSFKDLRGGSITIDLNASSTDGIELFEMDQIKPLPPVFRVGRKLQVTRTNGSTLFKNSVFGTPYGVGYEGGYGNISTPSEAELKKYILKDDKFSVQSFDMDIDFAIGDKVVVADWANPVNMLSVKIIQGFKFTEGTGDIHFILADKAGNLHQEQYVEGRYGHIFVGRIRKITNAFGKLTAGMKIKSKNAGVPHFPKKDANIIIGFLTDTGGPEPLVLCSNCCTLWYSDVVNNFTKISMKAKAWQTTAHAPIDVAKIKYQPGDILTGTDGNGGNRMGWLAFKSGTSRSLKIMDFRYYTQYADYFSLDRYMTANTRLDCIANPRIGPKAQADMGYDRAWANLHGYYFTCKTAAFRFLKDERSMVNVQSSPE